MIAGTVRGRSSAVVVGPGSLEIVTERPPNLPEFSNPPVVEVVLGVRFDAVREWRQAHFGLVWKALRERYPTTSDQARLETALELTGTEWQEPAFELEVLDSPPTLRSWFVSADEESLIQLQDDRLTHNWRHRGGAYPRFEPLQAQFWDAFDAFRSVLYEAQLAAPSVRQVEVSYINWIEGIPPSGYLRPLAEPSLDVMSLAPPDIERWLARYPVHGAAASVGTLTIESRPTVRRTGTGAQRGHVLSLTYIGSTDGVGDTADAAIDMHLLQGRDVIVKGFTAVTEDVMHVESKWGRVR